jgi:hypothetical protein
MELIVVIAWLGFIVFLANSSEDTKRGLLLWSWVFMLLATLGSFFI